MVVEAFNFLLCHRPNPVAGILHGGAVGLEGRFTRGDIPAELTHHVPALNKARLSLFRKGDGELTDASSNLPKEGSIGRRMTGRRPESRRLPLYERVFRLAPQGTLKGEFGRNGRRSFLGRDKHATAVSKFSHNL